MSDSVQKQCNIYAIFNLFLISFAPIEALFGWLERNAKNNEDFAPRVKRCNFSNLYSYHVTSSISEQYSMDRPVSLSGNRSSSLKIYPHCKDHLYIVHRNHEYWNYDIYVYIVPTKFKYFSNTYSMFSSWQNVYLGNTTC